MPRPFGTAIDLTPESRGQLDALIRAGSTPQALAFRCRVILLAGDPESPSNQDIAATLGCNRHTVGRWRERFAAHGLPGLQDAPRPGRPRVFSPPTAS